MYSVAVYGMAPVYYLVQKSVVTVMRKPQLLPSVLFPLNLGDLILLSFLATPLLLVQHKKDLVHFVNWLMLWRCIQPKKLFQADSQAWCSLLIYQIQESNQCQFGQWTLNYDDNDDDNNYWENIVFNNFLWI